MKKRLGAVLLVLWIAVSIVLLVFAYTRERPEDAASSVPEKPKVRLMAYGNYKVNEFLNDALAKFYEQDPPFVVELEVIPTGFDMDYFSMTGYIPGYEQRLLAEFAAGDPPDLFYLPPARGEVYRTSGALLELSEYTGSELEHYGLMVGPSLLAIAHNTQMADEAIQLLIFLHDYTYQFEEEFRAAFLEESLKMPGDVDDLLSSSVDDFLKMWNQLALSKNLEQLVVFPALFREMEEGFGYTFYVYEIAPNTFTPGLSMGFTPSTDNTKMAYAGVSMHVDLENNPEVVALFKECIKNLLQVADYQARINGPKEILEFLGSDEEISSFDFFSMAGAARRNSVEYTTWGPRSYNLGVQYVLRVEYDDSEGEDFNNRFYINWTNR
ncbi:MAG: hypothetical protein WAQ09_09445 [Bacillota bacterium]|jgi:hypothetical protein